MAPNSDTGRVPARRVVSLTPVGAQVAEPGLSRRILLISKDFPTLGKRGSDEDAIG